MGYGPGVGVEARSADDADFESGSNCTRGAVHTPFNQKNERTSERPRPESASRTRRRSAQCKQS